jgi:hypothetical protein
MKAEKVKREREREKKGKKISFDVEKTFKRISRKDFSNSSLHPPQLPLRA